LETISVTIHDMGHLDKVTYRFFDVLAPHLNLAVGTEPPIDLISELILPYHLTWCGSNKVVSLSFKQRLRGSIVDMSHVYYADGFQSASLLGALHFHS